MRFKIIATLFAVSYHLCPVVAQDDGGFGDIKSVKEVDAGLGFKNKEVEFYEKGNRGYNEVLRNSQNRQSSNMAKIVLSGGVQVSHEPPPGWTTSKLRSSSSQTYIRNRQIRNAQIEKHNQKVREHNRMIEEQRRQDEIRREEARREKERIEQQKRFDAEFNQVMTQTAGRFGRQVDFALQQRENMEILKNAKIDDLPARSGYVPSEGETVSSRPRQRTSLAGIVSKGGRPSVTGLDFHAVPITLIKDEAYYYKWEKIEIPQPTPTNLPTTATEAWNRLYENCSENRFAMLKHEIIKLNDGKVPVFLGYNDAGNMVFEGEKNIYSVTPNGDRIFFMSLEEKDEGIVSNYYDGKSVMDLEAEAKGFGLTADVKYKLKNKEDLSGTIREDVSTDLSYPNAKYEVKFQNDTVKKSFTNNFIPSLSAKAKITWFDNTSTGKVNYIRIGESSVTEFNASLKGGAKIEAEGSVNFNPAKKDIEDTANRFLKNSGIVLDTSSPIKQKNKFFDASADISLETISADAEIAYKRVKNIAGHKFLVSFSVGGGAGHKLSHSTYKSYGLYGKVFFNCDIEPLDADDVLLPIGINK